MKKYFYWIPACAGMTILIFHTAFAVRIPTGQDAGSSVQDYLDRRHKEAMLERLTTPKDAPSLDAREITAFPGEMSKIMVGKVIVQSDIRYKKKLISDIIAEAEGTIQSFNSIIDLADTITAKLIEMNIRAYIPEQNFSKGRLYINLREDL